MGINVSQMNAVSTFRVELSMDVIWKDGMSQAKKHKIGQLDPHVVERKRGPVRIKKCK
jgi:hypothetical protein